MSPREQLSEAAQAVLEYIKDHGTTTFVEISRVLEGCGVPTEGDRALFLGDSNICLWAGMSEEFIAVMHELQAARAIHPTATNLLVYLIDGGMLDMPIAKNPPKNGYKKPHWAPVVMNVGPHPDSAKATRRGAK